MTGREVRLVLQAQTGLRESDGLSTLARGGARQREEGAGDEQPEEHPLDHGRTICEKMHLDGIASRGR